jgi:RNA polymerase sigma-70 factor (ECF subfamily)
MSSGFGRQNSLAAAFLSTRLIARPGEELLPDEALAALYDQYGARLYRYAVLILADASAAEDAVQEAFCRMARLPPAKVNALTLAYVATAVRHECYTLLRTRRRSAAVEMPLLEPASPAATDEERVILEQALKALPAEQREVVFLKVYEGMTFQEIGVLCGIGINTAASRYRYGLSALRRVLAPSVESARQSGSV